MYGALIAGSEKGLSANGNLTAFDELGFAPHIADLPRSREMSVTVMGQECRCRSSSRRPGSRPSTPGRGGRGRAAAARGTAMGLSSFASKSIEEVCEANPEVFFQMYWAGDHDTMMARMERARAAGAKASS